MKALTLQEIKIFATRRNVRRVAVENFLMTLQNNGTPREAYQNLFRDAKMYRWNQNTIRAIKDGIDLAVEKGSKSN